MNIKSRYFFYLILTLGLLAAVPACSERSDQPSAQAQTAAPAVAEPAAGNEQNPFFEKWDTPYGIPPFDRIRDEHYKPAFERGIEELRIDVAAIRDNPEPPTFENTVEALELAGPLLTRVSDTFSNITNTDTDDALKALEVEIYPLLSQEQDAIYLDETIFARVNAVFEQRDSLDLDEQAARLLELTHLDFVRAGAALDADKRARMKEINTRLTELSTAFGQNALEETNGFELVLTDEADLSGLPADMLGSARSKAEARGLQNSWVFGLDRGTFEGFMTFAANRDLRKQMFEGYRARGGHGGPHDNRDIVSEIVRLRAERARLLGYANHADYQLETRMAKTSANAENLLQEVWKPALNRVGEELAEMQALVRAEGRDFIIEGHDYWYYAEKVRQQKYTLDESVVKPYFELQNVRNGAFYVANRLFGVTFEPLTGVPVWNPVVKAYTVHGADGGFLGVYMTDDYARESKRGGAWMSTYRSASNIQGDDIRPIVTNNLNLAVPAAGQPTLLTYDQVETVFHEFGHALHGLLTRVRYPSFAGTAGSPRDFVEFPSQFMENYATEPEVLAVYAKNAVTGEVIPQALVEKVQAATKHNQGFKTTEYIAASMLDLKWHELSPDQAAAAEDVVGFEDSVLQAFGKPAEIESRYRSPYFEHIFAGGYSAGYYAYLWAETLDSDGFAAFKQSGDIFNPELAQRLKENVYQAGAVRDADELYRQFRGQDPTIDALLENRGLN